MTSRLVSALARSLVLVRLSSDSIYDVVMFMYGEQEILYILHRDRLFGIKRTFRRNGAVGMGRGALHALYRKGYIERASSLPTATYESHLLSLFSLSLFLSLSLSLSFSLFLSLFSLSLSQDTIFT